MSTEYPYHEFIPVARLRMDIKNPRLPDVQDSQIESLHTMAKVEQDKLLVLAKHIVENGLNPIERFIVIPDDEDQFSVLDGNRRLTVLRALNTPEVILGYLSQKSARQLKKLAVQFENDLIVDVPCTVFENREHADPWVELIHDGESGGAGLVKWSAQQRSRFQSRKGQKPYHLQVLDYVAEYGALSDGTKSRIELGKYPSSTLKRLLGTPYVRDKLGVDKVEGEAVTNLPKQEVMKGLTRVVEDIGSGNVKVSDLMTQTDRINYINSIESTSLPDESKKTDETTPIEKAPSDENSEGIGKKAIRERQPSSLRKKLIPNGLKLNVNVTRLNDIYHELKRRLIVSETPNAVAMLMRAFLEMSVDEYIQRNGITVSGRETLASKASATADFMENSSIMNKNELLPIRRAVSDKTNPSSTTTLHGYMHNRRFTPGPDELKATWDTLELFIQKLWA